MWLTLMTAPVLAHVGNFVVYGPTDLAESSTLEAAGHSVTVWDESEWAAATESDFAAFDAIVIGDKDCSGPLSEDLQTVYDTRATWSAALTGNVVVTTTDAACHIGTGGALQYLEQAADWAADGGGTGAYFSSDWGRRSLDYLDQLGSFGSVSVDGNDVVLVDSSHPILSGLAEADLDDWSNTHHAYLTSWPSDWDILLEDTDGNPVALVTELNCDEDGDGYERDSVACGGDDCDDRDASINPAASETWYDDIDQDCDGGSDHDADGDGHDTTSSGGGDCDDTDAGISPDATETCDGVDNDCDGTTDPDDSADAATWYLDYDGDGFGGAYTTTACSQPSLFVADSTDCDDLDGTSFPGGSEACDGTDNDCDGDTDEAGAEGETSWYADSDGDGYGDADDAIDACDVPSGYTGDSADCDDDDGSVNPDGTEVCDSADNDCDGDTDEAGASDASTWYDDGDGDGYGDPTSTSIACDAPSGTIEAAGDCDDTDGSVNPDATEVCDLVDNDCDGSVDGSDATDQSTWYTDSDGDGHGDASSSTEACHAPSGTSAASDDCDDGDASIHPGATETCDGADNDCDSSTDEAGAAGESTWYLDGDGDGFGLDTATTSACDEPSGYVADLGDCDDSQAAINPDASEVCDSADNDCDGDTDEAGAIDATTWYTDSDEDGHGDPTSSTVACDGPSGTVETAGDCDDTDGSVNPDATEVCDLVDNDCDGDTDGAGSTDAVDWYADTDEDGYGDPGILVEACYEPSGYCDNGDDCNDDDDAMNPGATETWYDGIDSDCGADSDYDADGDGHDSDSDPQEDGSTGLDCDDDDASINPDAADAWYDGTDSDCDGESDYDADGDGFDSASYEGDDCDDGDPDTYPGAPDEPGDGVINDCDDSDEYDADGDGYDLDEDCDDNNSDVNPGAEEIWYDGIDQDCDDNDDDQDGDGWNYAVDCDDTDPDVWPGSAGYDDDCNELDSGDTGSAGHTGWWGDTGLQDTGAGGEKEGCGCMSTAPAAGWTWLWVGLLGLLRRRGGSRAA